MKNQPYFKRAAGDRGGLEPPDRPERRLQPHEHQEREHEQQHEHRDQSDPVADGGRGAGDPRRVVETGG